MPPAASKPAQIAPIPALRRGSAAQATPADMFRMARRIYLAGEKLDMNQLALRLGIARATLYRWIGDRDRLLVDVIWSLTRQTLERAAENARGHGAARLESIFGEQVEVIATAEPLRRFLEHEGQAGYRLVTHPDGVHGRLVQADIELIRQEVEAGHYRPPAELETLVEAMVSVGEHFLYSGLIGGFHPQPAKARRAIGLLLRENPGPPPRTLRRR
jgi:AcrR family transcriptional regulator